MNIDKRTAFPKVSSSAFELLLVFILSVSACGLIMVLLGEFEAKGVALLAAILTLGYHYFFLVGSENQQQKYNAFHFLLIILVGLFFRATPFNYVFGGQDQGIYVNIASHIARTGSVLPVDSVLDSVVGGYEEIYLDENYRDKVYLPGIYHIDDIAHPTLEFQFYHLFPMWMAMFEGLFGSNSGVYALTFLSILSLLFCYQLVSTVTHQEKAGLVAALLLALNPLHAFFSKWPVTEVPTLLFSLAGFWCLATYFRVADCRSGKSAWNGRYLLLSTLAFSCLFTTRISGFMYIPIILVIFTTVYCKPDCKYRTTSISLWTVGVLLAYTISVWYGWQWAHEYSKDIYRMSFSKVFGSKWVSGIFLMFIILAGWLVFIYFGARSEKFRSRLHHIMNWCYGKIGVIFSLIAVVGLYKVYLLAFTNHYSDNSWISLRWHLAGEGWDSVLSSSLITIIASASPFLVLGACHFAVARHKDTSFNLARFFLLCFFSYIALLQFFVPYRPYYDRYILSELVPYLIIIVVWGWSMLKIGFYKRFVTILLFGAVVYSGVLSSFQFGKEEQKNADAGLSRIAKDIGFNDLLLLHTDTLTTQIKTPLVFKHGLKVASITDESLLNMQYLGRFAAVFDDIYVLSQSSLNLEGLQYLGFRRVYFDTFNKTRLTPLAITHRNISLQLYRYDGIDERPAIVRYGNTFTSLPGMAGENVGQERRTNGDPGFFVYGPYAQIPAGTYQLIVYGQVLDANNAWVDVVSNLGGTRHAKFPIRKEADEYQVIAKGRVIIPTNVNDLEVRINVERDTSLAVMGYSLEVEYENRAE